MRTRRSALMAAAIAATIYVATVVAFEFIRADSLNHRFTLYADLLAEHVWVLDKEQSNEQLLHYVRMDGLLSARIVHPTGEVFAEYVNPVGITDQPDRFLGKHKLMNPRIVRVPIRRDGIPLATLEAVIPDHTLYAHMHSAVFFVVALLILLYHLKQKEQREEIAAQEQRLEREMREREEAERFQRELEQRVSERTAELEALNAELESFAYSVSHDLRAPLRAIVGFTHALSEDHADSLDDEGIMYLDRAGKAAKRMGDLINGLLTLSRATRGSLRLTKVDLSAASEQIIGELKSTAPDRTVAVEIAADLVVPAADHSMAITVLENLLANAWKFTSRTEDAQITIGKLTEDEQVIFFVRDNGVGFDATQGGQLFAPFRRLHSEKEFPGTGVGLATVQRIINRHGGRVWADARPGKGATFYFTFEPAPYNDEGRIPE